MPDGSVCQTVSVPASLNVTLPLYRLGAGRYGVVILLYSVFLFLSNITRTALLLQSLADIDSTATALIKIYAVGFLYDTAAFSYIMVPLVVYCALLPASWFNAPLHRFILNGISFFSVIVFVFTACAELFFWKEFGSRFNFVAVDYLMYRREVTDNLVQSYPLWTVFCIIGYVSLLQFAAVKRRIATACADIRSGTHRFLFGFFLLLLPCMSFLFLDGSLSRISTNMLNNNLAMNGIYAFFSALRSQRLNYASCYATLPESDVVQRLREMVATDTARFLHQLPAGCDIRRDIVPQSTHERRANVVLVVLESMSGEFLDSLGGQEHLTPHLDRLARQGLLFTNMYATGTRTVRGLEAISLSLPPTPPVSVLKRPHHEHLFTIGTPFQQRGYETVFFYGGRSYFDNMKLFYVGNGFRVIDRGDLASDEITFSSAWGVCDEDIYRRVLREADAVHGSGKNFFMMVMTTSNHKPFTYPAGRIDIPSGKGRKGAVKYADYAVGQFIEKASSRPWFENTIFIFVADHCTRSGGKDEIPIDNYHIPCIFYAPSMVQPGIVETLCSQIDIAPTLFDVLNWSYTSSFVGTSVLTMHPDHQRAFLNNHLTLGYLKKDMVVALKPGRCIAAYRIDPKTHAETLIASADSLQREAITYYQGASMLLDVHALVLENGCIKKK